LSLAVQREEHGKRQVALQLILDVGGIDMHPGIVRRGIAALVDVIVVVGGIIFVLRYPLFPAAQWANAVIATALALLYEPLLSVYAYTIGQGLTLTRIRDTKTMRRMSVRQSYVRYLIKYVATMLGSFGAVGSRGAVRAVGVFPRDDGITAHDLQAGTIVVSANSA
jgi:hypothetical protein